MTDEGTMIAAHKEGRKLFDESPHHSDAVVRVIAVQSYGDTDEADAFFAGYIGNRRRASGEPI